MRFMGNGITQFHQLQPKHVCKAYFLTSSKRVILEIYDAMTKAIRTGQPYQTLLEPPPANPTVTHPPREAST